MKSFLFLSSIFVFVLSVTPVLISHAADPGFRIEQTEYAGTQFRVVHLDPIKTDLRLYWLRPDGTPYAQLSALRTALVHQGRKFIMATNSGIYGTDFRPLGLHVENGKTLRPLSRSRAPGGNFSMLPNGIFLLTKTGARVVEASEYARVADRVEQASQSGPLLLHNNRLHPSFLAGSANRKLRSGVGVDGTGHPAFAISLGAINFYDFAMLFKTSLGCRNAVYLDGTISKLLVEQEQDTWQPIPFVGIWAATSPSNPG